MNEHHHYHNSGGGFVQGMLFGALIGAGLAFLLGTKQGKEIADEIKEKGMLLIDDFDDLLTELAQDIPQEQIAAPTSQNTRPQPQETARLSDVQSLNNYSTVKVEEEKIVQDPPVPPHIETLQTHGRHLFHGIPKRR